MLPLSYPHRWRLAGIFLLLAVLAVAMTPAFWPWLGVGGGGLFVDKWMHGFTFAMLATWYAGQYDRRYYGWLVLGLLAFGGFIEICQSMVTYRTAEFADFVADALGVLAGMLIAFAGLGGWSLRVESWLMER